MSRLVSELGADIIDDTPQKKRRLDPRKRNYIVGLSALLVAAIGIGMVYYFATTDWLSDYANMNYITYAINTQPDSDGIYAGKTTASIMSVNANSNYPSTFVVPKKIKGHYITSIEANAFQGCTRLKKVVMSNNIVRIGARAFINCENLESFTFSKNLLTIGNDAFYGTKYADSWSSNEYVQVNGILLYINETKFLKDNNADSFILVSDANSTYINQYPDSLAISLTSFSPINGTSADASSTKIVSWMEGVFKGFDKLKFVETPAYLTKVPANSFQNCTSLEKVVIKDPVTEIANYAFQGCDTLSSLTLDDHIASVGNYAFADDPLLVLSSLHEGLKTLGEGAFQNDASITSFSLPSTLTEIPSYAFDGTSLSSLDIARNGVFITSIGDYAFRGTLFTEFRFPKKTETISDGVFANCPNLETIYVNDNGPTKIGSMAFANSTNFHSLKVYAENGDLLAKCNDDDTIYFPSSIKRTDDGNYGGQFENTSVKHVYINNGIISLGSYIFKDCEDLIDVTFSPNCVIRTIDRGAFENCSSLTSISIPNLVKTIGVAAFKNCTSLLSVELPDSDKWSENDYLIVTKKGNILPAYYTAIKENVFENCTSLTTISIPYSVSKISEASFKGCTSLRFLFIPRSVTTIIKDAFAGCDQLYLSLEASSIPSSYSVGWNNGAKGYALGSSELREDEDYIYSINNDLSTVTIVDIKAEVGETIVIPSEIDGMKVTAIKDNFLNGNETIKEVILPDSLTYLGDGAFDNCPNLEYSVSENGFNYLKSTSNDYAVAASSMIYGEDEERVFIINENVKCVRRSALNNSQITFKNENNLNYLGTADNEFFLLAGMSGGITKININENTKFIAEQSFVGHTTLESAIISDEVEIIGKGAFLNNSHLSIYCMTDSRPDTWDYDWDIANKGEYFSTLGPADLAGFSACVNLDGTIRLTENKTGERYITIPSTVSYKNGSGQSIEADVTQIASGFLTNDNYVYSVYIPNTIPTINKDAFVKCDNLVIYCASNSKPSGWSDDWKDETTPAYWNVTASNNQVIIDGIVYSLDGDDAVVSGHYENIRGSIVIPSTVKINNNTYSVSAINDKAFASSTNLSSIYIPSSVKTISATAFYDCNSLTVYFEGKATEGFTDYYSRPLYEDVSQDMIVSDNLIEYLVTDPDEGEVSATSYLFGLAQANIPASIKIGEHDYKVTAIGDRAFQGNTYINVVTIGENVKSIGERAFSGCTNLQSYVVIPDNVQTMGAWVFSQTFADLEIYVVDQQKPSGWADEWDAYDYDAESDNDEIIYLYSVFGLNILWQYDEETNQPILIDVNA
ncbi:MAG: leucine-rich repeat protein [Bacilli bacterium]|nr:leucine-rich repeat protein [Bacilli bacterium]